MRLSNQFKISMNQEINTGLKQLIILFLLLRRQNRDQEFEVSNSYQDFKVIFHFNYCKPLTFPNIQLLGK